jgi:hypothetical protein
VLEFCRCFRFLQPFTIHQPLSTFFLDLALERMLGTLAGLRKIGVGAVRQRMRVAMRQLALHRIVAVLLAIIGLERTFSTVRIVFQMIGSVVNHGFLPRMRGFNSLTAYRQPTLKHFARQRKIPYSSTVSYCNDCDREI